MMVSKDDGMSPRPGSAETTSPTARVITWSAFARPPGIATFQDGAVANTADGTLDEVRISRFAESPAWIATEYANASSPAIFVRLE